MRSYREEWIEWGITTALQSLLIMHRDTYTSADILSIARIYGVDDALLHRMSYCPDTVQEIQESHP